MKKFFYLAAIMFAAVFASCSDDHNGGSYTPPTGDKAEYTFMMYACGGGDLDGSILSELVNAYQLVASTNGKVRFVGLYKASKEYQTTNPGTNYFELTLNDGVTLDMLKTQAAELATKSGSEQRDLINKFFKQDFIKENYKDASFVMYEPSNITEAIKYMVAKAPAKKYVFITDNHGGGWKFNEDAPLAKGQVFDDNLDNSPGISAAQLCKGVDDSGTKFDVLFDDLCLMATWENLYEYKATFPICIASAETTTSSNIGALAVRLAAKGGDIDHATLYAECADWVTSSDATTGYKSDWNTFASMDKTKDTDCQDMGCYDLTNMDASMNTPLTNIVTYLKGAMEDATKKKIIQQSVMTTLYTTLPFGQSAIDAYNGYRKTLEVAYNKANGSAATTSTTCQQMADKVVDYMLTNGQADIKTAIEADAAAKEYYDHEKNTGMLQGYPLGAFLQNTARLFKAAGNTAEETTVNKLLTDYTDALKKICKIKCSHDDYTANMGMDAYIQTSPTIVITSLNTTGFVSSESENVLAFSTWTFASQGLTLEKAKNNYDGSKFGSTFKWTEFLEKVDVNPCIVTNSFRSAPMYDAK